MRTFDVYFKNGNKIRVQWKGNLAYCWYQSPNSNLYSGDTEEKVCLLGKEIIAIQEVKEDVVE